MQKPPVKVDGLESHSGYRILDRVIYKEFMRIWYISDHPLRCHFCYTICVSKLLKGELTQWDARKPTQLVRRGRGKVDEHDLPCPSRVAPVHWINLGSLQIS